MRGVYFRNKILVLCCVTILLSGTAVPVRAATYSPSDPLYYDGGSSSSSDEGASDGSTSSGEQEGYSLGILKRTKENSGYYGNYDIEEEDPHFGWNIGSFSITDYTRTAKSSGGDPIFLVNDGGSVTLLFRLTQDIDELNNDSALSIHDDDTGYDEDFDVGPSDFGRGTLLIRRTDSESGGSSGSGNTSGGSNDSGTQTRDDVTSETLYLTNAETRARAVTLNTGQSGNTMESSGQEGISFEETDSGVFLKTNFLESDARKDSDIIVRTFSEGDYEVSLDYEIKNRKKYLGFITIPDYSDYHVRFRFSVRNGEKLTPVSMAAPSEESGDSAPWLQQATSGGAGSGKEMTLAGIAIILFLAATLVLMAIVVIDRLKSR